MAGEKRSFPGDHGAANGTKVPKSGGTPDLAAARAAAAKKAAEISARRAAAAATPPAASQPPAAAPAASGAAQDRLAAMKARLAAMQAGGAASQPAKTDTAPPPRRSEPTGPRFATTLGNRRVESQSPATVPTKSKAPAPKKEDDAPANPYFDPKATGAPRGRMSRGLIFNQHGKYLDQASKLRAQNRLEQIKAMLAKKARQEGLDENSERGFVVQQPPDVEWWDEGILEEKTYDCIDKPGKVKIDGDDSIITLYIQHPAIIKAPQEQRLVEAKPMYLTHEEQAKLRRMRRAADLKEHQAKIRLGLEPPPPPKVKRGNMMRVMGEQAIADPTSVELLVESQIQQRHDDHVKANEERKLSKEERLAKLATNQEKDAQKGLYTCAFKINSLAFGKHRYQIDQNAKQLALTGVTLFNRDMNLVIVEGGIHSIAKYKKLMLSRIKWGENDFPSETQQEKQAEDPDWMRPLDTQGKLRDLSQNECVLVFEGEIRQRAFRRWGSKICETEGEAKELLGRSKLDSLWALAKSCK
ncbi:PRP3-domain-containing protein [Corynespora cassiicola Philippines]|uniref:PRP3-domain-containing protein n=1 Tax=Corynespora cassiicola Philippines TaxID=1448308 RepID=A0A2T2N854_CORCC|nr:PRP3-domain-containing protein [Corynespora cassiicola Philippines]